MIAPQRRWDGTHGADGNAALFKSFLMAGYECSSQRRRDGKRLDLAARRVPERVAQHARLPALQDRLNAVVRRRVEHESNRLAGLEKLRQSLNPERPLELGFALVRKADGTIARSAAELASGERVNLKFKLGDRDAVIDGESSGVASPPVAAAPPRPAPKPKPTPSTDQGSLF